MRSAIRVIGFSSDFCFGGFFPPPMVTESWTQWESVKMQRRCPSKALSAPDNCFAGFAIGGATAFGFALVPELLSFGQS